MHDGELETSDDDKKELGSRVLFRIPTEMGLFIAGLHGVSIMFDHISNAYLAEPNLRSVCQNRRQWRAWAVRIGVYLKREILPSFLPASILRIQYPVSFFWINRNFSLVEGLCS